MEILSLPFRPGPGTARGRAAASPGDKESHTAPGHILNSSIVRQEEMCLGNVAVTTLKHRNSILTTSLRRCRSDKHAERGSRALPAAGVGRVWGWESIALPPARMCHTVKAQTHRSGRHPALLPPSAPTQWPGEPLHPKGRACIPPLRGYFDPHGALPRSYPSLPQDGACRAGRALQPLAELPTPLQSPAFPTCEGWE